MKHILNGKLNFLRIFIICLLVIIVFCIYVILNQKKSIPFQGVLPNNFDISVNYAFRDKALNATEINWDLVRTDPGRYAWIILEDDFCTKRYPNIKYLLIVHTAPQHFEQRKNLRKMYGDSFYKEYGIATLFTLGRSTDEEIQKQILKEAAEHHDIIQQSFWDVYETLALKAVMWLKFVQEYCGNVEYVFKIDDDVVINLYGLLPLIESQMSMDIIKYQQLRTITCMVFSNSAVRRNPKSKWYVTEEEFPEDSYSTYCSGMFYIIPGDSVKRLYAASKNAKFQKFEDYFITGRLASIVGNIRYNDISRRVLNHRNRDDRQRFATGEVLVQVTQDTQQSLEMWDELKEVCDCYLKVAHRSGYPGARELFRMLRSLNEEDRSCVLNAQGYEQACTACSLYTALGSVFALLIIQILCNLIRPASHMSL